MPSTNKKIRLASLDALRGFDMLWLLGAEGLFAALFTATDWPVFELLSQQFEHSQWHGFTFFDLIFPLFIFLSGVSLGLANKNLIQLPFIDRKPIYKQSIKRFFILCLLGVLYNHGRGKGIPLEFNQVRFASVLMRIAFAWFFCAMIIWHFKLKIQIVIATVILFAYWLLQSFIPTPNGYIGELTLEHSWNTWVDQVLLPGHIYQNLPLDPEGLLSQLPAVVNALAGAFAGRLLLDSQQSANQKSIKLLISGIVACCVAYLWSFVLPLNKTLWTSSFALLTIGYSVILLGLFYYLFDILKWKPLSYFFAVIGANSILLYILTSLFNWQYLSDSIFAHLISHLNTDIQALLSIIILVLMQWFLAQRLYTHRIFIHV